MQEDLTWAKREINDLKSVLALLVESTRVLQANQGLMMHPMDQQPARNNQLGLANRRGAPQMEG